MKYIKLFDSFNLDNPERISFNNIRNSFIKLIYTEFSKLKLDQIKFKIREDNNNIAVDDEYYYVIILPNSIKVFMDYYIKRYGDQYFNSLYYFNDTAFRLEYNRVHLSTMEIQFQGLGIGYRIFRSFLETVGWYWTIDYDSQESSYKLWNYLMKDVDIIKISFDNGFCAISKSLNKSEVDNIFNTLLPQNITMFCKTHSFKIPSLKSIKYIK